jgi:type III secretion protein L
MTLHLLDKSLLGLTTSRLVKRADYEQVVAAQEVVSAAQASALTWQAQLDAARQEATQAGHAAGVALGKEAWAQQLLQRHLSGQVQLRDLQATLVGVVMDSLRHLLSELPAKRRFELLAHKVLASVVRARHLRLVVAAADVSAAREVVALWQQAHADVLAIDVVADDALSVGDCVLETEEGAIDGRLSQRLATIEAALTRQLLATVPPSNANP